LYVQPASLAAPERVAPRGAGRAGRLQCGAL